MLTETTKESNLKTKSKLAPLQFIGQAMGNKWGKGGKLRVSFCHLIRHAV